MKVAYEREIAAIKEWVYRTNVQLTAGMSPTLSQSDCLQIQNNLWSISSGIQYEYPFYSQELLTIGKMLFSTSPSVYGIITLNQAAFGELFVIIKHIANEPINTRFWQDIHPKIIAVSKDLFCDGYFSAACESAIKEVETYMRVLFKQAKPGATVPKDASGLIGALLSENGCYCFCDTSDKNGENFRKGIQQIFEGAFTAYRNPAMHANLYCTQREAFERIVQASQMMNILTNGEVRK